MEVDPIHNMKLIRYRPSVPTFNHGSLLDELDRLFEAGFPALNHGPSFGAFPVDVYQDNDSVIVRAELPGFRKEDLRVDVADDTLTITGRFATGETKDKDAAKTETSLERAIALPENLNYDKVTAAYENGVLTVTLPKREEVKPKTVAVEIK
jgi:HSP20 family protein